MMNKAIVSENRLLDSSNIDDNLQALKRITTLMSSGVDVSCFFPFVVKKIVSDCLEVKRLVYLYILRYAEKEAELILMSVNTFQKDIKHTDPFIRANALRALTGIRLKLLAPIMLTAVQGSARDFFPYVRKITAHALLKIYALDATLKDSLIEILIQLLHDRSLIVLGGSLLAFQNICPERHDLLHAHYRTIVRRSVDFDEWSQLIALQLLTQYGRVQFANPNRDGKSFDNSSSEGSVATLKALDPDHKLLLECMHNLFYSRNGAVVLEVCKLYYYLAPYSEFSQIGRAMCRFVASRKEISYSFLLNIETMSKRHPEIFTPHLQSFLVYTSDPLQIKLTKISILLNLLNDSNVSILFNELKMYSTNENPKLCEAGVQGLVYCVSLFPKYYKLCLKSLFRLITSKKEYLIEKGTVALRNLLQTSPKVDMRIVRYLSRKYLKGSIKTTEAQLSVLWLVGEFAYNENWALQVLQTAVKNYKNLDDEVKLQVLNFVSKLHVANVESSAEYLEYIFFLAKNDQNTDIRERTCFLSSLLVGSLISAAEVHKVLLSRKSVCFPKVPSSTNRDLVLGTLSHLLKRKVCGYRELPKFSPTAGGSSLREQEVRAVENPLQEEKVLSSAYLLSSNQHELDSVEENFYLGISSEETRSDSSASENSEPIDYSSADSSPTERES
ncbi:AP-3 complex subunit beta-1-like isoform X3 [Zophobas morio]|uniref:AP-3 complex subunit beta-1-like isoform X3 n=1 Tax=Zophobas morio TaxID=2755281 RepID=UPI003082FAFB